MELVKGQIVTSRRGRDVTRVYVVAGFSGERVLLVDGAKRTLAAPKVKNVRHIQPTGTVLPPERTGADTEIKAALRDYARQRSGEQQGG